MTQTYTEEYIKSKFSDFSSHRVMVVGDVMIDAYLHGKVERISPEAPVPVVSLRNRVNRLGGASNVALNLKSMGADVLLCSVIGRDRQGEIFRQLLESDHLSTKGIISSQQRITTTKFRIIGNKTQMLRVDEETDCDLNEDDELRFIQILRDSLRDFAPQVVVMQDYNKGVLTREVISEIISLCASLNIPVAVDPKRMNFEEYKGVALFKPNLKEVSEGLKLHIDPSSTVSLRQAATLLHTRQNIDTVMITLSENGVYVSTVEKNQPCEHLIPAFLRDISDVSGAGDTVIAVAALCMASKTDIYFMAKLSNLAGGLVCEHPGVVPVQKEKLLADALQAF